MEAVVSYVDSPRKLQFQGMCVMWLLHARELFGQAVLAGEPVTNRRRHAIRSTRGHGPIRGLDQEMIIMTEIPHPADWAEAAFGDGWNFPTTCGYMFANLEKYFNGFMSHEEFYAWHFELLTLWRAYVDGIGIEPDDKVRLRNAIHVARAARGRLVPAAGEAASEQPAPPRS